MLAHNGAHIWTLASAYAEESSGHCPCVGLVSPPSFIGDNYYCESGTNTIPQEILYTNDPLWDGEQCEGRCCSDGRTPHGSVWTYPTQQLMTLRYAFVQAIQMKTHQ